MQVSNLAQEIVGHVLADRVFMDGFLKENRRQLYKSYSALCEGFEAIGLRVVPAVAGIFAFCDLRSLLTEQTFEAEHALFEALVARGVVFTPGHSCHCPVPGFFRVCYAYVPLDSLLEGVRRVKAYRDEVVVNKVKENSAWFAGSVC
jgi:1-aminocyclopropane-1-carboxylate synthase